VDTAVRISVCEISGQPNKAGKNVRFVTSNWEAKIPTEISQALVMLVINIAETFCRENSSDQWKIKCEETF
jgi:hypothetical protein